MSHANPRGLVIDRVFSDPSTPPQNQLGWTTTQAEIKDERGEVLFSQPITAPTAWSEQARKVVASKYFHGEHGTSRRETHVGDLVARVAGPIADWGFEHGYFASEADASAFHQELTWLLLNQHGSFNSPVWFNVGVTTNRSTGYVWDDGLDEFNPPVAIGVRPVDRGEHRPQASACFINSVEDSMESIMALATTEAMLFRSGSGTGTDLSTIRSRREKLSGGGTPSGPMSFLKVYDAVAGVVKSGGKCLAYAQPVYTAKGPIPAEDLAASTQTFEVLSYSRRLGRVAAKQANAWFSGAKPCVKVVTDKGEFLVSYDHPFILRTGQVVKAEDLTPGLSLLKSSIYRHPEGYPWVQGSTGEPRELLHRLVAKDVNGWDIDGKVVHHDNEIKTDCRPNNLVLYDNNADHIRDHGVKRGAFYTDGLPGEANGMHASSDFWADEDRSSAYRQKQGTILRESGRAGSMQAKASRQKMLNLGYELINTGHDISTFEDYCLARYRIGRRVPDRTKQLQKFVNQFGSYDDFLIALSAGNHRVVSVTPVGEMGVVSIEVHDDEPDDKRDWTEHNYGIAPVGSTDPYGSVVFTANTRRAAKMNTISCVHPDVMDFIGAKAGEDRKAQALRRFAGCSGGMNGEAAASVAFQNANLSVRVSNAFMNKVIGIDPVDNYSTIAVTTGEAIETLSANAVMDAIAEGTLACGDPGAQYADTINAWHTCPNSGRINTSNPCGEFQFLDDTACNLASLNLVRFRDSDGQFDLKRFEAAVRIFFIAQEILVDFASYPTARIAQNSHDFRPLGLGYCNLGALLMTQGLPYDSNEGRDLAGAITSLMQAQCAVTTASLARAKGPFPGYAANREPFLAAMRKHGGAAGRDYHRSKEGSEIERITDRATDLWLRAISAMYDHGARNAQFTVLAPTGTIAFMMDAATTGIEPDIALVKYKSLAGGGMLKIVNPLVGDALINLGYGDDEIRTILDHIHEHGTIEGCGVISDGDPNLSIFDCAFPARPGGRSISPEGHLKMMAAVQPFLSGAISKTVNLPRGSTAATVRQTYIDAWKMGIKAVAIYVDGSKESQAVSTTEDGFINNADLDPFYATLEADPTVQRIVRREKIAGEAGIELLRGQNEALTQELEALRATTSSAISPQTLPAPTAPTCRHRLPETRPSLTHKFAVGGHEGYLTVGLNDQGQPAEMFVTISKSGSALQGMVNFGVTMASVALQHGASLETVLDKMRGTRFAPSGFTASPEVRTCTSLLDYFAQWLELTFARQEAASQDDDALYEAWLQSDRQEAHQEAVGDEGGSGQPIAFTLDESLSTKISGLSRSWGDEIGGVVSLGHPDPGGLTGEFLEAATVESETPITIGTYSTGEACENCGSFAMVPNGKCLICVNCGVSPGNCGG